MLAPLIGHAKAHILEYTLFGGGGGWRGEEGRIPSEDTKDDDDH